MSGKLFESSLFYKPFFYPHAIDLAREHERVHWIEDEVELAEDVSDWKIRLTDDEKNFITQILKMFIASDVNVGSYYDDFLIPTFKNKEVRSMLKSFSAREEIHKRAYALLNDTLGLPEGDYAAFLDYKEMKDKHEFMLDANTNSKRSIAHALAKSVFSEGVSLFASFVMLLNFQRRGLMKGMGKVVEWSVRDEAVIEGTEVLTPGGWVKIEDLKPTDKVLQFDMQTQATSFVNTTKIQHVTRNKTYIFSGPGIHQHVSPNHRMIFINAGGDVEECTAENLDLTQDASFINGYFIDGNPNMPVLKYMHFNTMEKAEVDYAEPVNLYCLAVPGKAFFIRSEGKISVTGNTMHFMGLSWLFSVMCKEHSRIVDDAFKKDIYQMARDCVRLEDAFVDLAFKLTTVEGVTADDIKSYVRYVANRRLTMLGLKENWDIKENPLPWVDVILNAGDHTNFFEGKVTDYELATLVGEWAYSANDYIVYGRDGCEFCTRAKTLLDTADVLYQYVDLTNIDARTAFYGAHSFEGKDQTMPKIFSLSGGEAKYVGGYAELAKQISA